MKKITHFYLLVCLLASMPVISHANLPSSLNIKVSSFNIRWYGLGGSFKGVDSDEDRDLDLKTFIHKFLKDSDVVIFQEIVDVSRFKRKVIGGLFNCLSYDHPTSKHQHIVLCHKPKFGFAKIKDESNYILENVAINRSKSRPALYGVLTRGQRRIVNIFGIHLKAFPHKTETRLEQVEIIAKRIKNLPNRLPSIIVGDFNTHSAENTGNKYDDAILMESVFKKHKKGMKRVQNSQYTYRNEDRQLILDHFWVSSDMSVISEVKAHEACNLETEDIESYNEDISDHCPISATFQIKF